MKSSELAHVFSTPTERKASLAFATRTDVSSQRSYLFDDDPANFAKVSILQALVGKLKRAMETRLVRFASEEFLQSVRTQDKVALEKRNFVKESGIVFSWKSKQPESWLDMLFGTRGEN